MADNFVQFSVEVPVTGKRQRNFFHRASLKLRAELEDKGYAEAGSCDFAFTPTSVVLWPDEEGKRRFTLTWPVEPRVEGFPNDLVLVTRRGQCFNSAQWREFLAKGALDVTKNNPYSETKS